MEQELTIKRWLTCYNVTQVVGLTMLKYNMFFDEAIKLVLGYKKEIEKLRKE